MLELNFDCSTFRLFCGHGTLVDAILNLSRLSPGMPTLAQAIFACGSIRIVLHCFGESVQCGHCRAEGIEQRTHLQQKRNYIIYYLLAHSSFAQVRYVLLSVLLCQGRIAFATTTTLP